MVAPGGDATVTFSERVLQETFGGGGCGYYIFQGTSMATPDVSGAAAQLHSKNGCQSLVS